MAAALLPRCALLFACAVACVCVHSLSPPRRHAVVVGAGPVGMAAALALASHHDCAVTVVESSPASSAQTRYDPTKAFLYNVNGRGQSLTKQFPGMHRRLVERGVPSSGSGAMRLTIVPGDPDEALPRGEVAVEGTPEERKTGAEEEESAPELRAPQGGEKAAAPGYWLPRHEMVKLMKECVDEHNAGCAGDNKITFSWGQECVAVEPLKRAGQGSRVCVMSRDVGDGSMAVHEAALVVGADGMNSRVRRCLAAAAPGAWQEGFDPKKFELRKWTSPASHLRIKVLQFPPKFEIPDAPDAGGPLVTNSEGIYALRSVNRGPRDYLSLGLLPMKDDTAVRPTNIVTRPDHEVWDIKDGPAMQKYFQKAFPRFDFDDDGMVSKEEWERFAKAEGTRFPHCQRSEGLAAWVEGEGDGEEGACGVALVGDACHAFPPDIGQGVNAGLADVVSLDRALRGRDPETGAAATGEGGATESLGRSLGRYQERHGPEVAALIRLSRFGAPYQYRQPHRADRVLHALWMANVAMRLVLSKLTFGIVPPSCIILSQNKALTFRQVMQRADLTTAVLKTAAVGGLGFWVRQRYGLGFLKALLR